MKEERGRREGGGRDEGKGREGGGRRRRRVKGMGKWDVIIMCANLE